MEIQIKINVPSDDSPAKLISETDKLLDDLNGRSWSTADNLAEPRNSEGDTKKVDQSRQP